MSNIHLIEGDITTAAVDAVVNAANPGLLGGGGVDGAIHRAAGPQLVDECRKIDPVNGMRCPYGDARLTGACALPAKYVIHAVGPRYRIDPNPSELLASAYARSLDLALAHACATIAFPAISCGAYGYPLDEAAEIAISVCGQRTYKDLGIYFYLFGQPVYEAWAEALARHGE